jgi:ADP-ribose pyrophosphatase YjhB (NUDIX family)
MEFLDVYDKTGKLTGKIIARGDKNLADDEFIKLVVVWLKCGDKFLIQKTSKEKGGEFAVVGGHVPTGKTSLNQASVELEEELGIVIAEGKFKTLGSIIIPHAIFDVLIYEDENLVNYNFTLQESEVEQVKWLTKKEIENLISEGLLRKSSQLHYEKFIKNLTITKTTGFINICNFEN